MIKNLAAYNAWKRSTLDRLTAKFKRRLVDIFHMHLRSILPEITESLRSGSSTLKVSSIEHLSPLMERVFREHMQEVVRVGVSDGYREVTPDKKLSTWEAWPYWYPVEDTFVSLAEKKIRDGLYNGILKKISSRARNAYAEIASLERERYLKNLKAIYSQIADRMFKDPDGFETEETAKDIIKRVFQKTEAQAQTIFRTETTRYFNDARVAYFQNNTDVDFVQLMAITDGRISDICEARDGYVIPIQFANMKKYKPPFHPNCRTVQSPLDTDLQEDRDEVTRNLGVEFGAVYSETSEKTFKGTRQEPRTPLPRGWA